MIESIKSNQREKEFFKSFIRCASEEVENFAFSKRFG